MSDDETATQRFVSWHASLADLRERDRPSPGPPLGSSPPFAISEKINRRLVLLHAAEPWALAVDALVVGNNEALTDRSGMVGDIFKRGGLGLERDVLALETVRTGEAKDTPGHSLTAQRIVHAVGPRYRERYVAAAESALHWAYRSTLQLCRDKGLRTVAMLPLHDIERKQYPREEGCHVALRTIRRFFERNPSALDVLLLITPITDDFEAYSRLLPLYFPRSAAELRRSSDSLGGHDLGDADGERVVAERQIRIGSSPGLPSGTFTPSRGPVEMSKASAAMAATAVTATPPGALAASHHSSASTATPLTPQDALGVAGDASMAGGSGMGAMAAHYEWVRTEPSARAASDGGPNQSWSDLLGGTPPSALTEFRAVLPGPDERHRRSTVDAPDLSHWGEAPVDQARRSGANGVGPDGGHSGSSSCGGGSFSGGGSIGGGFSGSGESRASGGQHGVVAGGGGGVAVAAGVAVPTHFTSAERPWWEEWWEVIQETFEPSEAAIRSEEEEAIEAARRAERLAHQRASELGRSIGPSAGASANCDSHGTHAGGGWGSDHQGAVNTPRQGGSSSQCQLHDDDETDEDDEEVEARRLYDKMIRRAQRSELSRIEREELVYSGPPDRQGRRSLILVASRIHALCHAELVAAEIDEETKTPLSEAVALLLLRESHQLAGAPFVILFLTAGLPDDCGATLNFLRTLLVALPMSVHKQLHRFYLIHPTLLLRLSFTIVGIALWGKLHFLDYLRDLHEFFIPGQLLVPQIVMQEDARRLSLAGWLPAPPPPRPPPMREEPRGRVTPSQLPAPPSQPAPRPPPASTAVAEDDSEVVYLSQPNAVPRVAATSYVATSAKSDATRSIECDEVVPPTSHFPGLFTEPPLPQTAPLAELFENATLGGRAAAPSQPSTMNGVSGAVIGVLSVPTAVLADPEESIDEDPLGGNRVDASPLEHGRQDVV